MPRLSTAITVLLAPVATARLTTLLTQDQLTAPLREAAFNYFDTLPPTHPLLRLQVPYLITCPRCVSVYAAAATLLLLSSPFTRLLVRTLALSQLALNALDAADHLTSPTPHHANSNLDYDAPTPNTPAHTFTPEENYPYA